MIYVLHFLNFSDLKDNSINEIYFMCTSRTVCDEIFCRKAITQINPQLNSHKILHGKEINLDIEMHAMGTISH